MKTNNLLKWTVGLVALFLVSPSYAFDIEIDPIAFALNGYSFHIGLGEKDLRLDAGAFGLEVPDTIHGQKEFTVKGEGYSLKIDYLFGSYDGWFVGVEANRAVIKVRHQITLIEKERTQATAGFRTGYRFVFANRLTVTPWLGVDRVINGAESIEFGNARYEFQQFQLFPTVHLGWHF